MGAALSPGGGCTSKRFVASLAVAVTDRALWFKTKR
jgi:hypothetical protein